MDALIAALQSAGCTVRGKSVTCAFHGDRTASGSIYQSPDGRWRYKCFGCDVAGDEADITSRHTGRPLGEVLKEIPPENRQQRAATVKPRANPPPKPTFPTLEALVASLSGVVDVYRYAHPVTRAVELAVIRLSPKSFPQAHPVGTGWQFGGVPDPQPIYNRERIATADTVVICEGEKDCKALHAFGVVATTSPMGADTKDCAIEEDGKPGKADWSPLAGKDVILWGDNDAPGKRHLLRLARILTKLTPPPRLYGVRSQDIGEHKDAADFIAAHGDSAGVLIHNLIRDATPLHASAPLRQRLDDVIAGKLRSISWPWPSIDRMTQALIPGAVTILVGNPGATKSFMVLQSALYWLAYDIPFALYEMEEDMAFWLARGVAVHSKTGTMTSLEWIAQNAQEALRIEVESRPVMDRLAQSITVAPPQGATLDQLAEWVERNAKTARVIILDPITAALEGSEKQHIAAQRFMLRAKRACEQNCASLILTTHGRKQDGKSKITPDLDCISGGAAYARFASAVIWLEPSAEDEVIQIMSQSGDYHNVTINRRLRILKARSGRGTGVVIGLKFNGHTLNAEEVGVIMGKRQEVPQAKTSRSTRGERIASKPSLEPEQEACF